MKFFKNISVSQKAFIAFIAVFSVIIMITLGITYLESSKRLEDELSYSHTVLLKQMDQSIDSILGKIDGNAMNFILNKELVNYMDSNYSDIEADRNNMYELSRKLMNFSSTNEYISSIYIYSKTKDQFFTQSGLYKRNQFYDSACIEEIDKMIGNYSWLSTRKVGDDTNQASKVRNVITLVRPYPLTARFGPDTTGVIVINIDENALYGIINNAKPNRLGQIFIIDKVGIVVAHVNKSELGKDLSGEKYVREIIATIGKGSNEGKSNGGNSSIFFVTSPYTNWSYISKVPNDQINAPLVSMRNAMIWVGVVMFLLANIFVLLINRWTFKPIDQFIRQVADKIKNSGDGYKVNGIFGSPRDLEKIFGNMLSDNEKMSEQIKESIPAMKWRLAMDILGGYKVDYNEASRYFGLLGISLYPHNYMVMVIDIDNKDKILESIPEKGMKLYTTTLSMKVEEIINEESICIAIELIDEKIGVIISFEDDSIKNIQMRVLSVVDIIKSFMYKYFSITISVGVGNLYKGFEDINKSYKEANEALKYRLVIGNNSTIFYEEVCNFDNKELYRIYSMVDDVPSYLNDGDTSKISNMVSKIFKEVVACNFSPEVIRQVGIHLVMQSVKFMIDSGIDKEDIMEIEGQTLYDRISQFETLEGLHECIEKIFVNMSYKLIEKKKSKGNNEFINAVVEYIKQNYTNTDLSLKDVADKFNISVPYLSKLFKDAMDCNFVDYLISVRMEKAKQLLQDNKNKISEIGAQVGYINYYSFTRIFKKYTGNTPGDYRNQIVCERALGDK